mgnify:CR=1 FL=1
MPCLFPAWSPSAPGAPAVAYFLRSTSRWRPSGPVSRPMARIAQALARAQQFAVAPVTAADINADALAVARQNIADTGARVTLRQGDLFAAAAGERFDIIVSNPPYITAEEMADLQPEVCREPALALYGGLDGLDFYRRIAREAPDYLLPGGWLLLEIGSAQAEAVSALLAERFEALAVYPDMQGLPRAVAARLRECARV